MAGETERRISQDVTDISSSAELLRYALAGQLERLLREHSDLSQAKIAEAARLGRTARNAGPVLSRALSHGPTADQLLKLDEIIAALASDLPGTGGLASLALQLSAEGRGNINDSLTARVPSAWTRRILSDKPSSELEVLVQGSALLSAFMAAERAGGPGNGWCIDSVRKGYRAELALLVRRLILISLAPPTPWNYDAEITLGGLASYAFEPMRDLLEAAVQYSPMAFRLWRAITTLVQLRGNGEHAEELRAWVRRLIRESGVLRKDSLYAGRSLDLELALAIPAAWSPPGDDWVGRALHARAADPDATIRERGTAVMGLWQRALEQDRDLKATEADLRKLIARFRDPAARPDAAAGLRWVAETLEQAIDKQVAVCGDWPAVDEPWYRNVHQAARELDSFGIPDHLRTGAKNLFLNMILQNAAIYRRHAIETVVTSGWSRPIAMALGYLLRQERDEAWLRIRVEFALGFLQRPNPSVEADLTRACLDAYQNLKLDSLPEDKAPPRSRITEMHASLFAVGDCFGAAGAEERSRSARDTLQPVLTKLAETKDTRARILRRAGRAAAYLLTMTAQPRLGGSEDLSETLLTKLSEHPDGVTARLSKWALSFRFAPDGSVRPLLDAAELGKSYDNPY